MNIELNDEFTEGRETKMKLYHGTGRNAADEIENNGFLPSGDGGFTPMDVAEVVFFADNPEDASEYGTEIFEIEDEGHGRFYQTCPLSGIKEYYIDFEMVEQLIYNRI